MLNTAPSRTSFRRLAVAAGFLAILAPVAAAQGAGSAHDDMVLKADDSAFPKVRLYLEVPDASWTQGKATVDFKERDDNYERVKAAIALARAHQEGDDAPEERVTIPPLPGHSTTGEGVPFTKQEDSQEDLLVVFLLDHSGSMMYAPTRKRKERHQLAIDMVTRIIKRGIRARDQVSLVLFAEEIEPIFGPSSDHAAALKALNQKYVRVEDSAKKKTYIFNSIDSVLDRFVSMKEVAQPTLFNRRIVVVISDGKDEGSEKPEIIGKKFKDQTNEGVLVTLGLGATESTRDKTYGDLGNIASAAGKREHHSNKGTVEAALETFVGATKNLQRQVMVEFEVPRYHWRKGEQDVIVSFKTTGEGNPKTQNETYTLHLRAISADQVAQGDAFRDALVTFADQRATAAASDKASAAEEKAEEAKEEAWKRYGIIGGSILFLLIIFGIVASKKRQARNRERLARLDALEDGMAQQMADQERKILDQMDAQKKAADEEAQRAAEAARTVLAVLTATDGALKGRSFPIKDPRCLIGRDEAHCHLAFPNEGGDLAISRVHAELSMQGGGWLAVCMSDGGMHVNQSALRKDEQYPLQFGDTLSMGKSAFRFGPP